MAALLPQPCPSPRPGHLLPGAPRSLSGSAGEVPSAALAPALPLCLGLHGLQPQPFVPKLRPRPRGHLCMGPHRCEGGSEGLIPEDGMPVRRRWSVRNGCWEERSVSAAAWDPAHALSLRLEASAARAQAWLHFSATSFPRFFLEDNISWLETSPQGSGIISDVEDLASRPSRPAGGAGGGPAGPAFPHLSHTPPAGTSCVLGTPS